MALDILIVKRIVDDYAYTLYFETKENYNEYKFMKRYTLYREPMTGPIIPIYSFLANNDMEAIIFFDNLVAETQPGLFPNYNAPGWLPKEFIMWVYRDPHFLPYEPYYHISVEIECDKEDKDAMKLICSINWKDPAVLIHEQENNQTPENILTIKIQREDDYIYNKLHSRIDAILKNDSIKEGWFNSKTIHY